MLCSRTQELSCPGIYSHQRLDTQSGTLYTIKGARLCPESKALGRAAGTVDAGLGEEKALQVEKSHTPGPFKNNKTPLSACLTRDTVQVVFPDEPALFPQERPTVGPKPTGPRHPFTGPFEPRAPILHLTCSSQHLPLLICFLDTCLLVLKLKGIMRGKIKTL